MEVRRRIARLRRSDREGRGAHRQTHGAAGHRAVGARRDHRPAARRRPPRPRRAPRRDCAAVGDLPPPSPRRGACAPAERRAAPQAAGDGRHGGARIPRALRRHRPARQPRTARRRSPRLARRAHVGTDSHRCADPGRPPRGLRRRARGGRDRRASRLGGSQPRRNAAPRTQAAAAAPCLPDDRRRPRVHRPRARRQRDDNGTGRHGFVGDAARSRVERPARRVVEGCAGHPDRRPQAGA